MTSRPPLPAARATAAGPTLELLVHGVGGHTPQEMLNSARTVRVSGDDTAALYRRVEDVDAERRPGQDVGAPAQEAYCWSGLTSGNGSRALWLLLLPFMVVNLAHWMRPDTHGLPRVRWLYGALVRLLALTLTVLFTAAACEVALDLTAWQCAGSALCAAHRSWLGFLSPTHHGWWSQPGRRVTLAAVVPTGLVALLWYLSARTWAMYEAQRPPNTTVDSSGSAPADRADGGPVAGEGAPVEPAWVRPGLARPGFWFGRRSVARLRAAHTAAGFLTVGAVLVAAALRHDSAVGGAPAVLGRSLQLALALCGAVTVWVVCRTGRDESVRNLALDRTLTRALPCAGLALLALGALYAAWGRGSWAASTPLAGEVTFRAVALAQAALVVALGGTAVVLHRTTRRRSTVLYGLGGPAVAMLACGTAGVMSGGVAQRVADWLDGGATPGMGGTGMPVPPVLLSWQASLIPILLVVLLVPVAVLGVRAARAAGAARAAVLADYDVSATGPGAVPPDSVRTRQIATRRALARLTDVAPWLLGTVSGAGLVLGAGALALSWITGDVPGRAAESVGPFVEGVADTAQGLGSWFTGFGFLVFITLGRKAYSHATLRQTIGILWDVGTFWPRAAHPFAPPCYAERVVPDLTWRIATWTRSTGGRLVLSAHSQGTVLAAAALWQLGPDARRGTALLTYGSPLERLYGRWFPAYFGEPQLRLLHGEVANWRNLWRETDPIGGPVGADWPERRDVDREPLKDPQAYGRSAVHPLPESVNGHGDYPTDPAYLEERAALLGRLPVAVPTRQRAEDGAVGEPQGDEPVDGVRTQGSSGRSSG